MTPKVKIFENVFPDSSTGHIPNLVWIGYVLPDLFRKD